MDKKTRLSIIATVCMGLSTVAAAGTDQAMEKCTVVDKATGKGLIKAHMADCSTSTYSCAGSNPAGDPEAWIMVPKGQCAKINAGDLSGVPESIRNAIDLPNSMSSSAPAAAHSTQPSAPASPKAAEKTAS